MSKDNLYVEVIGGSLDKGRERQIANIYNHRGESVCDQVWQEDAEEIARRWNAHDGLVAALKDTRLMLVCAWANAGRDTLAADNYKRQIDDNDAAIAKAGEQQ